eukprot:6784791-Karenia_brevis.AAC.1
MAAIFWAFWNTWVVICVIRDKVLAITISTAETSAQMAAMSAATRIVKTLFYTRGSTNYMPEEYPGQHTTCNQLSLGCFLTTAYSELTLLDVIKT